MAKRRGRKRDRLKRESSRFSKYEGLFKSGYVIRDDYRKPREKPLLDISDRRRYFPVLADDFPKTIFGTPAKVYLARPKSRKVQYDNQVDWTNDRLSFVSPAIVNECIRRRRRRESLFALKRVGKGIGLRKPKRLTIYSYVRC